MDQHFESRSTIYLLAHEVSRLFHRSFEDAVRSYAVTLPQWRVVRQLYQSPGCSQTVLASAIGADAMTVGSILDRLENRGFVSRSANPSDSRAKLVRLTDSGDLLYQALACIDGYLIDKAMNGIDEPSREALNAGLRQISHNLHRLE